MMELAGKKFVMPVANLYDEREFWYPYYRVLEAGGAVTVVGDVAGGEYKSKVGMAAKADKAYGEVRAEDFDAIVIPGGFAPDYMRRNADCVALVKAMCDQGKLVAYICHAGWVPISAGIVKGRRATSVWAIRDDMINAGCLWEDKPAVVDGNMITGRHYNDLPEFMKAVMAYFAK